MYTLPQSNVRNDPYFIIFEFLMKSLFNQIGINGILFDSQALNNITFFIHDSDYCLC